jgi:hypothetical protein
VNTVRDAPGDVSSELGGAMRPLLVVALDGDTVRRLRLLLIVTWVLVAVSGAASVVLVHVVDTELARDVGEFLSLGLEQTPATWVASILLATGALLAVVGALEAGANEPPMSRGWWLLAAVLGLLSIDEVADIHGRSSPRVSSLLGDTSGVLTFAWIIPALVLGVVFLLIEGPFLRRLGATGLKLVIAGSVFVAGAVGLEMIEGEFADRGDQETLAYDLFVVAEELLEFGAVMWVIMVLVAHLRQRLDDPQVLMVPEELADRGDPP